MRLDNFNYRLMYKIKKNVMEKDTEKILNEGFMSNLFKRVLGKGISETTEKSLIKTLRYEIEKSGLKASTDIAKDSGKMLTQIQNNIYKDKNLIAKIISDTGVTDPKKIKQIIDEVTVKSLDAEKKAVLNASKKKGVTRKQKVANNQAVVNFEESIIKLSKNKKLTKPQIKLISDTIKNARSVVTTTTKKTKGFRGGKWFNFGVGRKVRIIFLTKKILGTLATLGIAGTAVYLLYQGLYQNEDLVFENEGETPTIGSGLGNDINQWPKPIQDLVRSGKGRLSTSKDGKIYFVRVMKTGNQEYDNNGGLDIFLNGKIQYVNGSKKGNWKPKQLNESITDEVNDLLENITNIININNDWTIPLINEQVSNEITLPEMRKLVDTAVDDLDGYVAGYNLKSLLNILNSLKGKTHNGKNAISAFLDYYKQDEHGDDFISDVSDIGTGTFNIEDFDLQKQVITLAKSGGSTPASPSQPTNGDILNGIEITWGGGTPSTGTGASPVTTQPKQTYNSCTDFPFEYGCKSDKIREIQAKVEMLPKYQTGNFGPITLKKLSDLGNDLKGADGKNYITKELYDKIMGVNSVQPSTGTTGTTVTTEPQITNKELSREDEYVLKYPNQFNQFKGEYLITNPNASDDDVKIAFTQKYQEDLNKYISSPGTYQSNSDTNIIAEDIKKIKDMFKRLI